MPNLGPTELVVIVVLVLIVFGAGKLPTVFGQLGKGVRTFRDEAEKREDATPVASSAASTTTTGKFCTSCGKSNAEGAKFCVQCGTPLAA